MKKQGYVYILTNKNKTTLYIGVTSDLQRRFYEHNNGTGSEFTKKYKLISLIYYEMFDDIISAIEREKCLKGKSRKKKELLISMQNPDWEDLSKILW